MKQIIEISESGLYAVVGEKIYRLVELVVTPTPAESITRAPKPAKKANKVKSGHKGKTHCKICDGYGHFAKTCPKRDGSLPPEEVKRPEVTKEQVDELRAKGYDSLRIAATLKTSLSEVNKHW